MRWFYLALLFTALAAKGETQTTASPADTILAQETTLAKRVEGRTHIDNFEFRTKAPEIRIDGGIGFSRYDGPKKNIVHEEHWEKLPAPMQATFNQWASYAPDEPTGQQLFGDMFYRFFFVHELGHWMQDEVLIQRRDNAAKKAKENSGNHRWQYELGANRISVAWWREQDPAYLTKLVTDMRAIQRKLPNPVPPGQDTQTFFTTQYMKLTEDPNAYGWLQLQMVLVAYDEQPALTFQQAIDKLPMDNYDQ